MRIRKVTNFLFIGYINVTAIQGMIEVYNIYVAHFTYCPSLSWHIQYMLSG